MPPQGECLKPNTGGALPIGTAVDRRRAALDVALLRRAIAQAVRRGKVIAMVRRHECQPSSLVGRKVQNVSSWRSRPIASDLSESDRYRKSRLIRSPHRAAEERRPCS